MTSENKREPGYYYQKNKEYAKKWNAKFERFDMRLTPEQKERWRAAAADAGESLNTFVIRAVEARIGYTDGEE